MAKGEKQEELVPDASDEITPQVLTLALSEDEAEYVTGILADRKAQCESVADRSGAKKATVHAKKYEIAMCERLIGRLDADGSS